MMNLIFATNNQHKVEEIKAIIGDRHNVFNIISLKEAGINIDIPEPFNTLEENASTKSATIYKLKGDACFSEDTGLETEALNGEPGVKSARYAGEDKSAEENMFLLLEKLNGVVNRKARFRTVISLIIEGNEHFFEGICEGTLTDEPRGGKGFGYDPLFIPDGETRTFAEMSMAEKNKFSHRKKAIEKLTNFLSLNGKKEFH